MTKIKALTLYQPWATLIAIGAKKIETRSWDTKYRGPLAIHASKNEKFMKLSFLDPFFKVLKSGDRLWPFIRDRLGRNV